MAKSRFAKAAESVERTRRRGAPSKTVVTDEALELIEAWLQDDAKYLPFGAFDETANLAMGGEVDPVTQDDFTNSEEGEKDDAKRTVNNARERLRRNLKDALKGEVKVTVLRSEDGYTFGLTK